MLSIRVQFLAGYSGREWPPSPARLFKALVGVARSGWAAGNRAPLDDALRWIENRPDPPVIASPEATLRVLRQRRFVPNNSKNWPTQRRLNPVKGIDLEPEPIVQWDINAPAVVWYAWHDASPAVVSVVRDLARRVISVGKGEDFAIVDAMDEPPPSEITPWLPVTERVTARSLEIPDTGCLDVCDVMFQRSTDAKALPVAGTRTVSYALPRVVEIPLHVSVFALWSGGRRRSWDARLLRQIVGPVRRLLGEVLGDIVEMLASGPTERLRVKALAESVLLGHDEGGNPVRQAHLAVLPIPSILGPYPDGRIRRIALVGLGSAADAERRTIVQLACTLLHGQELVDNGVGTGVSLQTETNRDWFRQITRKSDTWVSVTPIVQVATELTSKEWRRLLAARQAGAENVEELTRLSQRLQDRRRELVIRSLGQAVAPLDARPVDVEILQAGPIAGVHLARNYRVAGYLASTSRVHLRVRFDRPIAGPIVVGRGRHVGFGLLWPDDNRPQLMDSAVE